MGRVTTDNEIYLAAVKKHGVCDCEEGICRGEDPESLGDVCVLCGFLDPEWPCPADADAQYPTTDPQQRIINEIKSERSKQDERWGIQNHPSHMPYEEQYWRDKFRHEAEAWKARNSVRVQQRNDEGATQDRNCAWDGILLEEVFEALCEPEIPDMRAELIQAAAVIVAWVECLDRRGD